MPRVCQAGRADQRCLRIRSHYPQTTKAAAHGPSAVKHAACCIARSSAAAIADAAESTPTTPRASEDGMRSASWAGRRGVVGLAVVARLTVGGKLWTVSVLIPLPRHWSVA